MRKNITLKANMLVCLLVVVGFTAVVLINYKTNQRASTDYIEQISALTSDGIRYRLESIFAKPVSVSQTMAASPLLIECLQGEKTEEDAQYTQTMQTYLGALKEKYNYDSVFLVSAKTNRYYNPLGIDRILDEANSEDSWYYSFLDSDEDYSLNVDNDEAAHNEITIFVNCRMKSDDGTTLGIVGVGVRINGMQSFLEDYAKGNGTDIYLINNNGGIEIAADNSGFQPVNFFEACGYPQYKEEILQNNDANKTCSWWLTEGSERNYVVAQYIPEVNWHLIVEHNTALLVAQMNRQFMKGLFAAIITGFLVLIAITYTTNRYNKQIIELTAAIEREKQAAFRKATEQLYDNIYELNITKNCAMGDVTKQYFESLGMPGDTPYGEALIIIARKNVKEEYQDGYIRTFSPKNVLSEFSKGNTSLTYDMLSDAGGSEYYWLRIMAHIYYRKEDESVCMYTYRKNVDAEKRKEAKLSAQAQLDGLTNVYNKTATVNRIEQMLLATKEDSFAFFIIDIDYLKQVNDTHGHAFGDFAISEFAAKIKSCFREGDVVGRIGGDEFAVFLPVPDEDWAKQKVAELSGVLDTEITDGGTHYKISASIGVATTAKGGSNFETLYKNADTALYETKRHGRNGYSFYDEHTRGDGSV